MTSKKRDIKQLRFNSVCVLLFLFQFSVLIPLMHFVNPTYLIAGSTLVILVMYWANNASLKTQMFSFRALAVYLTILSIFLVKVLLTDTKPSAILYMTAIVLPVCILFSYPFDLAYFIRRSCRLSYVVCIELVFVPFFELSDYMRFGYGILLPLVFIYLDLFTLRHKSGRIRFLSLMVFAVGLLIMVVYGARGCAFSFLLFAFIEFLVYRRRHLVKVLIVVFLCVPLFLFLPRIVEMIETLFGVFGLKTYALIKFRTMLEQGLAASSSGRDVLYSAAVENILTNPFFGGSIDLSEEGGAYVHNLFLQVGVDLGFLGLALLAVFLLVCFNKLLQKNLEPAYRGFLVVVFSISIGRLTFSSTLWRRPEFWMLVCSVVEYKRLRLSCALDPNAGRHHARVLAQTKKQWT